MERCSLWELPLATLKGRGGSFRKALFISHACIKEKAVTPYSCETLFSDLVLTPCDHSFPAHLAAGATNTLFSGLVLTPCDLSSPGHFAAGAASTLFPGLVLTPCDFSFPGHLAAGATNTAEVEAADL